MRATIALAIYVSLAAGSFAEGPNTAEDQRPEWTTIYEAGLAATQRHSYEEAVSYFKKSFDTSLLLGERASAASSLGATYRRLGRSEEARQWLERARREWSSDPNEGLKLAITTTELADLHRESGDYAGSERLLRGLLDCTSCDAAAKGLIRNNLADLLREEGRDVEAQPLFQQSIESTGMDEPAASRLRSSALIGLADIARYKGDWPASTAYLNQALEIARTNHDDPTEAIALRGLGMTWLGSGAAARAEPLLRRALQLMETNPETPGEQIASALSGLGELYRAENKLALAEGEWSRALQIERAEVGEVHPQVAWLMEMLSDVYSARGEFGMAREYAARASDMMKGSFGENSMPVAAALTNLALVEQRARDLDAAAKYYERAIDIARNHPEHRSLGTVMLQRYAQLLKTMHRAREAKAMLAQGLFSGGRIQRQSFQLK